MFITSVLMILILLVILHFSTKIPISVGKINLLSISIYRDFGVLTALALAFWIDSSMANEHYIMSQIPKDSMKLALYASFLFMFFFLFYGYFLNIGFNSIRNKMPKANESFFEKLTILWLFILIFFVGIMYFKNPPVLTQIFQGATAMDISVARSEVGGNAFFKIIRNTWVPLTSYTLLYFYLKNKKIFIFFVLSVLLAVICSVWSGAKASLASLILGYLGVYIIAKENLKFNSFKVLAYVIFFFMFILFMYYITTLNNGTTFSNILITATYRFFVQAAGVSYAFYMYPTFFDFKYFSGISNFISGLSSTKFSSVYGDLIDYAAPEFADISGALSSFAAGDAYGLFGWWGILIGPFFAAFFYYMFYCFSVQGNAKILFIGMYGLYFGNAFLASSFYSFIWPVGLFISIAPFLLFYIISCISKTG
ncbi:oligosaccharide repeat unit polymerase [Acinetobacter johnsonii]|uniref:Oligosaccharide repeat unit polymerase n=1 Tax=Acinetobacter johnsonii TaxID=40214 RepID=A0AA42MQA3_ACIJO|nr:O-antigen ligase [Acinetobacter johnsonii]MDH0967792.1 oligosaccharide repeat unit polymerase [Acinetobacter johnsonii]